MKPRTLLLLGLVALAFAVGFLFVITSQRGQPPVAKPPVAAAPIAGKLTFKSIDDLRVNGRRILLCGAAFTKPASMLGMVTASARADYNGLTVTCKPVGTGTPCDGNVAASFAGAMVVQCFMPDGADLAAQLTQAGLLCGRPSQAGATYKPC